MGIHDIHILHELDDSYRRIQLAEAERQEALIIAHRRGEHPYGFMRRDCPLCQQNK